MKYDKEKLMEFLCKHKMKLAIVAIVLGVMAWNSASANPWAFHRHVGDNAQVSESNVREYVRNLREQAAAATERLRALREHTRRQLERGVPAQEATREYANEYRRILNLR